MNGRYAHAHTPKERLAIAVVAALHAYFQQHPKGVAPGQGFLADFLEPFVERERWEAVLEELHGRVASVAPREKEVAMALGESIRQCEAKMRVK